MMYNHLFTYALRRTLRSSLLLLALLSISPASFAAQDPNDNYFISKPLVLLTGITEYAKQTNASDLRTVRDEMVIFNDLFTKKCGYQTYGTCLDENHEVKDNFYLSKDDLEQFIQEKKDYLVQNVDKFDALIFIFSGHGSGDDKGNDTIYTSDGKNMYFADIKKQFTHIQNFGNHPKLFFKLACRGSEKDPCKSKANRLNLEEEDEKNSQVKGPGKNNKKNKVANVYSFYASASGYTAGTKPGIDIAKAWRNNITNSLDKTAYNNSLANIIDNIKGAISDNYDNDRIDDGGTLRTTKVFFKWGLPTVAQQLIDKHENLMIMEAFKLGNTDFVNYLVENGKGIALKQAHMDYACKKGNLTLVQYLVSKGVPPKQAHMEQACGSLNLALVKYLENKGLQATHYHLQNPQLLHTLKGHKNRVYGLAYRPDGKQLASGSSDKTLKLWEPATGVCVRTLFGHKHDVNSVAYSPDGKQLASASFDKTLKLWDTATGKCVRTLSGHTDMVTSVAYRPDGKQLASASGDKTLKLWDPATGKCVCTLSGHTSFVESVAYSPDGKELASAAVDKTLKLWKPTTGQCLHTLQGHTRCVRSVAYSLYGTQLASAADDKTIKLWDTATGECVRTLSEHTDEVNSVAYSPDGKQLASASFDKTLKLWDTATGKCQHTLSGHTRGVVCVAYAWTGRQLAAGSFDNTIKLWGSR